MRRQLHIVFLVCFPAFANWVSQSNWSSGPGYPGPSHYWTTAFDSASSINWSSTEGFIYLEMNSLKHYISGSVSGTQFVYPGDINGDGAIDVVTSSSLNHKHVWFENDGTGSNWTEHLVHSSSVDCYGAYPVDIDGDSDLDVLGTNSVNPVDSIYWFENLDGLGTDWGVHLIDTSLPKPYFLIGADIDGDLDMDLIAASDANPATIIWYENLDGDGSNWQQRDVLINPNWDYLTEIKSVDLDLDGDLDVLGAFSDQNGLVFCENENDTGTSWSYYQFDLDPVYEVPYSVHSGDLDGDGDQDVAVVDGNPPLWGRVLWLENLDGSCENWDLHVLEDSMPGVNAVHIADITDDGNPDIIVGSGCGWGAQKVLFWDNIGGTGDYFARRDIDSGYDCWDVSAADIDGDGVEDVVSNNNFSAVYWISLQGKNSGSLTSSILDMWGYPEWHNFNWEGSRPSGAVMCFQVRGSNVPEEMGEWSENIYDPGSLTGYLDSTYRYIQYKVTMESNGSLSSPLLSMIGFEYDNMGVEEGEAEPTTFSISSNPSYSTPSLSFKLTEPGYATIVVYDLTGREVFSITDEWPVGTSSVQVSLPSMGTYFAVLRSSTVNDSLRFVLL